MLENKRDKGKTQKLITIVATHYVPEVVLDLLSKSFEVYKRRDVNSRNFQVSVLENAYATAAIVLTVLSIEAYRNRIFYLERRKERRKVSKDVAQDISDVIWKKNANFRKQRFQDILSEVFVVRDVIVHNHIYEVNVFYDGNWEMLGHRQKLLEGYGDNKRFKNFVNSRTRKTKFLKFNVQPAKIGFEDLITLLAFFDLFVGICQRILGNGYVPTDPYYEFDGNWERGLSKIVAYYYAQVPNTKYVRQFDSIIKSFKDDYAIFLAKERVSLDGNEQFIYDRDYVVNNFCPRCVTFGFYKPKNSTICHKCGLERKSIPIPL